MYREKMFLLLRISETSTHECILWVLIKVLLKITHVFNTQQTINKFWLKNKVPYLDLWPLFYCSAVQLVQTPQTPGQMSDSLIYYDEDQAQLRNQLIKLSRRVALMEKEQQTLSNWIKLTYAAAIGYFILKIAFWSK